MTDRVQFLAKEIRRHRDLYYNGTPEISDAEFDALEDELRKLDPENKALSEVGAPPAKKRGADLSVAGLPVKKHKIPMGSLEKVPEDRLDLWAQKAGPLFLMQEKLDGISLEIEYQKGKLEDAITRGDGLVGEVVTHNAVQFQNVKEKLPGAFTGSVRGEVILRKSVFEEYFAVAEFANPRNTVSGTVRKKHGDLSLNRHLEIFFYDVVSENRQFKTEREKIEFLRDQLGLQIAVSYFDQDMSGVRAIYAEYQGSEGKPGKRFEMDYEIDGLVVRANSIEKQEELGVVSNRPRFAMAYKFPSTGQETTLLDVEWSLGIGARVTPVARLEPVEVSGVTVSNATLHNWDYVEALGVRLGDVVLVERKGDVIPQVVRLVEAKGGKKPAPPKRCPVCSSDLEVSGKHLRCPNRSCPGKSYGDLIRWISEMEIDSLGEKWVEVLIEKGLIADPADLYSLRAEMLVPLERMGETLAGKIVRNIEESRRPTLDRFIAALNIPEFSRQRVQVLMKAGYDTLEKLQAASVEDFASVKGFGEILAEKAVKGLSARSERIQRLLAAGVEIQKPEAAPSVEGPLAGKTFCFTGAIKKIDEVKGKPFTRKHMEDLVVKRGGKTLTDVTSKLDFLVMADPKSRSSKAAKARELGTKILSEEEFFEMIHLKKG
jgi:DNA ligase (NAD+)